MYNIPITTTQDILWLALAGAAVAVAGFLCWTLYYLAQSLRDVRLVTHDIRRRFESLWAVIELAREKLQVGGAMFTLVARGVKELAEHARVWTENQNSKSKRKSKVAKNE